MGKVRGNLGAGISPAPCFGLLLLIATALGLFGCAKRPTKVPGETDIHVVEVMLTSKSGQPLELEHPELENNLAMRVKSLIYPERYYSQFREAEDQRRLIAFWKTHGYFDVAVDDPIVDLDQQAGTARIVWKIEEGPRYKIASVHLLHAPEGYEGMLQAMIPFGPGESEVDFEKFREVRNILGDRLRREQFGHALVLSRAFVDREHKLIHWYFYVDAGPKTVVGNLSVDGAVNIPEELILERVGYHRGDPYDLETLSMAEFHLIDTGAFTSAFIRKSAKVKFLVPGVRPDTGGVITPEQVDDEGNYVPRDLPEKVDLKVHVVEAPSRQMRLWAGLEGDPTRIDAGIGSRVWFRNLFGPFHHLVLEGHLGYGWLWRDASDQPLTLYGEALVRTLHPMALGRLWDLRMSARFRDELYPGYHLREATTGPGVRSTLTRGLFFDIDTLFRYGWQVGFGPFDQATRDALSLPSSDDSYGVELQSSIIWDERDNPVEALKGHLLSLRGTVAPGEALNTHRYALIEPDARAFLPLSESLSLALRASGGWVVLGGDDGVPLGPRLFGGGAWGMRGFGRQRLSPEAISCTDDGGQPDCENVPVGGLSLAEASFEGRFLPHLKPVGIVGFVDAGGAGAADNPFEDGLSMAGGLGFRLRFWYLPVALDASYRFLDRGETRSPKSWDPFLLFLRIGEAF